MATKKFPKRAFEILGNNLTKRFKLSGPSKLHSAKSLEGTALCNAFSQKRKHVYKKFSLHAIGSPSLEYGSAYWDPCRGGQINALDRVQKKAAQFTNHTKDSYCETLAHHRTITGLCALFKAYSGEWTWKAIGDRLRRPYYLSRVDHVRKIRDRKQRTGIGKHSFVNRTIKNWNQLAAEALGALPYKPKMFRNRVRKAVINGVK